MYSLTYLETASDLANMMHALATHERERLTAIIDADPRKQDYLRAERAEVSADLTDISATYKALGLHFDAYRGDAQDNAYLELTPEALRRSLGMVGMLRHVAQAEADRNLSWSYAEGIDVDTAVEWRITGSDLLGLDYFLYGKAQEINAACIAFGLEALS